MIRKFLHFILHSRLEDVMAVAVSAALLVFFSFTRMIHSFQFGLLDVAFILLPVGILGVKCLLGMLLSSNDPAGKSTDPVQILVQFFRPLLKIVRDWFPFLLLAACYYSLFSNLILRVNPHTVDGTLARIDAAIFGGQPSILLQPWIRPWLTNFFSLVYFSYVLFFPGVALYFYLKGDLKIFRTIMMGYLTLILMGVLSYLTFPAIGPGSYFADRYTRDVHGEVLIKSVDYIMLTGHVSYDCFPSLHVGIPLLLTFYLYSYRRKFFIPAALYVVCMCGATIYMRYHYFIDVAAAFVYAPTAYFLNNFLLAHWPGEKIARSPAAAGNTRPGLPTTPDIDAATS